MENTGGRRTRYQIWHVAWLAIWVMIASCGYPDLPLPQFLSCMDLAATCGAGANDDCCRSAEVTGGTFYRSYDGVMYVDMNYPATVSTFVLDKYEVTVGRFRAFVNAGLGTTGSPPAARAGAHPNLTGSGWDRAWNTSLAADTAALTAAIKCSSSYQTWTDTPAGNENEPVNCLTWYEAMAFCIWDGGYLPTEAEWNYAASGGSEQRAYPWSNPAISTSIDCAHANYKINNPTGMYCVNGTTGGTNPVGSESPKGDGRWEHSDLAGNVWEWTLDWYASSYPIPCNDCANVTHPYQRVIRGGSFESLTSNRTLYAAERDEYPPDDRHHFIGVRCARTP